MSANLSAMNLLLATRNQNKTREFTQLLGPNFILRALTRTRDLPEIRETGRAFEDNAVIKAIAISKVFPHEMVIADDSGLEVDALNGAPGVFSARYGGENASDQRNVEKLLRELQGTTERSAWFRCVIALAKNGELIATFVGEVAGAITNSPRGENGFGYDPIFIPKGFEETFAELTSETKNAVSHRAKAVAELVRYFNTARRSARK
jgi:XTP/dITP diphosphohydrolase